LLRFREDVFCETQFLGDKDAKDKMLLKTF